MLLVLCACQTIVAVGILSAVQVPPPFSVLICTRSPTLALHFVPKPTFGVIGTNFGQDFAPRFQFTRKRSFSTNGYQKFAVLCLISVVSQLPILLESARLLDVSMAAAVNDSGMCAAKS